MFQSDSKETNNNSHAGFGHFWDSVLDKGLLTLFWVKLIIFSFWVCNWASFPQGQQLFSFQSPAVHRMARTSSLNAFPVEILTKSPIHWIASSLFTENPFFSLKSSSSHPLIPLPKIGSWVRKVNPYGGNPASLSEGVQVLEIAVGLFFSLAPARFSLVRIFIRDLVADRNPYQGILGLGVGVRIWSWRTAAQMGGNRRFCDCMHLLIFCTN